MARLHSSIPFCPSRRLSAALMLAILAAMPAAAANLCLRVTVNDQPAGQETRLRLTSEGQPARTTRLASGTARFDALAPGAWKLSLQHPKMKQFRTTLPLEPAAFLLDCGHADEWSGCIVRPLSGGC